jgi:hypothetical protein
MKFNKKNEIIIILIIIIIIIYLIYYLLNYYEYYEESVNTKKNNNENKTNSSEEIINSEEVVQEPSGKCNTENDIVDFCINYNKCCSENSTTKACLCGHPFIQKCRSEFETCLDNPENIKLYGKKELMDKCLETNKQCCIPYNSISISNNNFKSPIKNNPKNNKICVLENTPNAETKCLELCTTRDDCMAYSLDKGELVQTYNTCNLYNAVSIDKSQSNAYTGKSIKKTNADYYIKK